MANSLVPMSQDMDARFPLEVCSPLQELAPSMLVSGGRSGAHNGGTSVPLLQHFTFTDTECNLRPLFLYFPMSQDRERKLCPIERNICVFFKTTLSMQKKIHVENVSSPKRYVDFDNFFLSVFDETKVGGPSINQM